MKNIKYLYCKETNYPEKNLQKYLSKDDVFVYRIVRSDKSKAVRESVVETIEKISNESDDERFYNYILTDNGKHKIPRRFHTQMENEYGLKDDVEWWVAHFFIGLSYVLFSPDDEYE